MLTLLASGAAVYPQHNQTMHCAYAPLHGKLWGWSCAALLAAHVQAASQAQHQVLGRQWQGLVPRAHKSLCA